MIRKIIKNFPQNKKEQMLNHICIKIVIYKGYYADEVIYYRNKLPMQIAEKWRWYFEYLAALVKVNNPKRKVELTICAQNLLQGDEYIKAKSKTLLRAKKSKLNKLKNTPLQDDFFGFTKHKYDDKIKAIQSEINDLENGKFKYYVPPIYINKIKTWIKR